MLISSMKLETLMNNIFEHRGHNNNLTLFTNKGIFIFRKSYPILLFEIIYWIKPIKIVQARNPCHKTKQFIKCPDKRVWPNSRFNTYLPPFHIKSTKRAFN